MHLSWTFSRYFSRLFLSAVGISFLICLAIIFLADFVELLRRTTSKDDIGLSIVISMALLRLPSLGAEVLPFAVLIGGMASLLRLNRSQELVVARAAGVSVWQFLMPAVFVAFFIGVIAVTVYNPVAATMVSQFGQLESKYIKGRASLLSVAQTGFWLREADATGKSVVHALRGSSTDGIELQDVIIFRYTIDDVFSGRLDAASAVLRPGYWQLTDAWLAEPTGQPTFHDTYQLPTELQPERVHESFNRPETISFWDLPEFIELAEEAGFSARQHRIHFYSLLASPILFCTMVLVAATFSMRISRLGGVGQLVVAAIFAGFMLFFLTRLSLAFGSSGIIPPILAAWAPTLIAMLLGLSALFHLEDG